MRARSLVAVVWICLVGTSLPAAAAPAWVRVDSPHFTVVSDAGARPARFMAWQFEQVRAVLQRVWPWATLDTGRPVLVFAVKDEGGMKALVPQYWERKGGVRPSSVFLSAQDRHYIVIRTDGEVNRNDVNAYWSSYWSYIGIVVDASFGRRLPPWLTRGLASVMANTIVRSDDLTIGKYVPWHLDRLQKNRLTFDQLTAAGYDSSYLKDAAWMEVFDASSWALVHFLMFGELGANLPRFTQAATAILRGADVDRAVADAFGGRAAVVSGYERYASQAAFAYQRANLDVDVKMDAFTLRTLGPGEAPALRAWFLAVTGRPAEAAALVKEARAAAPGIPMAHEVEGLLADRADDDDAARAAYAKASELGGASYYSEFRLAALLWPADATPDRTQVFERIVGLLERSIAANGAFAGSRALMAQALLGLERAADAWPHAQRAISMAPAVSSYRLTAARVLHAQGRLAEAKREADRAMGLADAPNDRRNAQQFVLYMGRAADAVADSASAEQQRALVRDCQAGVAEACGTAAPFIARACEGGQVQACHVLGYLYEIGRGLTADAVRAATLYDKACAGGADKACVAHAMLQWRGEGMPQDESAAMARLAALCAKGLEDGCMQYAVAASTRPTPAGTARAREVFDERCKAGMAKACEILGGWPK